jgi:hypothetical protein
MIYEPDEVFGRDRELIASWSINMALLTESENFAAFGL